MADNDLASWLLEQIAEDEALAQALPESPRLGGRPSRPRETYRGPSYGLSTFLKTISPKRMMVECDAKRRIIDRHTWCEDTGFGGDLCEDLRLLALPYTDRHGYREEWKP